MDTDALAEIADSLYAAGLDGFIAARAAAAKVASGEDKELAAAVRALPKPSVAAWAVNMLVRHSPGVLAGLSDLGTRMRSAQDSLDAAALRALSRERRTVLGTAVDTARTVAAEHGRPLSAAVATDVEETLRALTADEAAAAAVASGRLLKVLSADGVNQVDLDGAVALPGMLAAASPARSAPAPGTNPPTPRTTPPRAPGTKTAKPRLEAVRQTPRPASPPALERAKAVHAQAQAAAEEASRRAADLQAAAEEAQARIAELQRQAAALREQLKAAEERLDHTRRALAATSAEAKQAVRAADKAARTAMLAHERVLRLDT